MLEEKLREAGKESSKQQKQNKGRNNLLKKEKTSYEDVNNKNLGPYVKNQVLKYSKFLPDGWAAYTPRARNSLCYHIFDGVVDVPFNCVEEIYWNNNIVPFISALIVSWRSNANEGIKKVFKGKFISIYIDSTSASGRSGEVVNIDLTPKYVICISLCLYFTRPSQE